jgi:hypothetical protein
MEGPQFRVELIRARELRALAIGLASIVLLIATAAHLLLPGLPRAAARPAAAPAVAAYRTFMTPTFFGTGGVAAIIGKMDTTQGRLSATGLWLSLDGGSHWSKPALPPGFQSIAVTAANDGTLLLTAPPAGEGDGSADEFAVSTDRGRTWTPVVPPDATPGRASLQVVDANDWVFQLVPSTPAQGQFFRLYRSADQGRTWNTVLSLDGSQPGAGALDLRNGYGTALFVDHLHGWMTVFGGTWTVVGPAPSPRAGIVPGPSIAAPLQLPRLLATEDGGRSWRSSFVPSPPVGQSFSFTMPRQTADGRASVLSVRSATDVTVYESGDFGATWSPPVTISYPWAYPLTATRWLAEAAAGRFFLSVDGARTWAPVRLSLPDVANSNPFLGGSDGKHLWLWGNPAGRLPSAPGHDAWLLRSDDGGGTWHTVGLPHP